MKTPLFNNIERKIIRDNDSLFASNMRLHIAVKRFEKEVLKGIIRIIKWMQLIF